MQENPSNGTGRSVRYPIWFKIFVVSLIPTLTLLIAALLNHQYLNSLGDSAEQILSKNYKSIRAAQAARSALEEARNPLLVQMPQRPSIAVIPEETLRRISANLHICRENITEDGERELVETLLTGYGRYEPLVMSLNRAAGNPWTSDRFVPFLSLTAELVRRLDDLVRLNEGAMERAELQTRLLAHRAQRQAALLFGSIIVAILALSVFLSYRIGRPIMMLANRLSGMREGSGVYPVVNVQAGDEIGYLADSFNRLFTRLEQYDHHRDDILAGEKEKVRHSEEAKGRFIADISHQLKTPMTSLAMSTGMLHARGDALNAEKRAKLVATAYEDCTRLAALINELVDISRLEAMSRPRPKETLDINVVIRECIAPLRNQAEEKGIHLDIEISEPLPQVTIDSFRFPWVITNLVGNALRYTGPGGRIELKVFKRGGRFYFQCTDTGSGIDPKYLPHIFDRFTQFSERGKSGTIGLGLAIVKDIIEQHGGDVEVKSRLGEGTTFTFWIPAS
ncbi:MAG: HAMP domain-containing sensor histidine kinase [Desulfobacterales bacterium]|jgi:signal transduction histidine kinase|nr:HAMP domain-containing sensor histidine kinase [Desulfobacterales bacterium]